MPNKVKHLRGTDAEWAENDIVLEDGEFALAISERGRYRLKIGNGVNKFSELEMYGGEVRRLPEGALVLSHGHDVRLGTRSSLSLTLTEPYDDDFYAVATFDSPDTPTSVTYTKSKIKFSGCSVVGHQFVPEANMHYTLIFWNDGTLQCHVRGVYNE